MSLYNYTQEMNKFLKSLQKDIESIVIGADIPDSLEVAGFDAEAYKKEDAQKFITWLNQKEEAKNEIFECLKDQYVKYTQE